MPNVGSIFRVEEEQDRIRYFWCVGVDQSQLKSALIVVFRSSYRGSDPPDFAEITSDEVDFYCHAFLLPGKKLGYWTKVGFRPVDRSFPMLFRCSEDYGDPSITVSKSWYVWEPNRPYRHVGKLNAELRKAELGVVPPPDSIVHRIRTGQYDFVHPT